MTNVGGIENIRWRIAAFCLCGAICAWGVQAVAAADRGVAKGDEFAATMEQLGTVEWARQELRPGLNELSRALGVAILIDRRIDPQQEVTVAASGTWQSIFTEIARAAGGELSAGHDIVMVAPKAAARRLQTAMELAKPAKATKGAGANRDIGWDDFAEPRDVVRRIAQDGGLRIEGMERIPYDLWAGARLPSSSPAAAITVILNQFDLALKMRGAATAEIVAAQDDMVMERSLEGPAAEFPALMERAKRDWPDLQVSVRNRQLRAIGRFEDVEALRRAMDRRGKPGSRGTPENRSLESERISLKLKDKPLLTVVKTLQANGVTMEYDEQALAEAGVDWNRLMSAEFDQTPAPEFFKRLFEPAGVKAEIVGGNVVRLSPAMRKSNP